MSSLKDNYAGVIQQHRDWLKQFEKYRLKKWEDLLKADSEAAICEAMTRKLLSDHNIEVRPYEDLSKGGPDFLCSKDGKTFYVETTCITEKKLTEKSGMPPNSLKAGHYPFLLTGVLLGELCDKTVQCSGLNSPCALLIGTLHFCAGRTYFGELAAKALLTGTPQLATKWDFKSVCAVGALYQTTALTDSAFIRYTKKKDGTIEYARNTISAVILCAFRQHKSEVIGVLHPNPNYPFDRTPLSGIKFCRLAKGYQSDQLSIEWI